MSFRNSSCLSFSSPNMRSVRTSENPMIAFSGVRNSWDMFREEFARLQVEVGRLASAIASGGELSALLVALQERERRLVQIRGELANLDRADARSVTFDTR